jgi:hypothetical protein
MLVEFALGNMETPTILILEFVPFAIYKLKCNNLYTCKMI